MKMVPRRAILSSASTVIAAGCISAPTENTEPASRPTVSPTATGPVERSLVIRNEFETEQTVSLRIIEYRSGFPEDGWDGGIQSVTATPAADERVERYDSELTIDADGRETVRDVFTLADSPRKYYLSFESDDVAEQEYTFTIEKGAGFSYLSITLGTVPDIVIITQ